MVSFTDPNETLSGSGIDRVAQRPERTVSSRRGEARLYSDYKRFVARLRVVD
jgi:hypothetical protein